LHKIKKNALSAVIQIGSRSNQNNSSETLITKHEKRNTISLMACDFMLEDS